MRTGILLSVTLLIGLLSPLAGIAAEEHAGHGAHHQISAEQLAELRRKIPLYRQYSDAEIVAGMARMRNSWGWVGDRPRHGKVGILALAHGFKERGNRQFTEAFAGAASRYPVTYAFGMAMMSSEHIRDAVAALEGAGAETIIVLPTTTADHSTLVRQWDYIFGREEESAYLDVPRVQPRARLIWADTPTAHPLMAEIMLDHARELSRNPANELVIIMGHGPQSAEDNARELEILARHAAFIQEQGGFMDVRYANVQDDAPREVRAANVAMIRGWAQEAHAAGHEVIVVTTALTQSGVVGRMQRDIADLARFNSRGLMEHPRFGEWIDAVIDTRLAAAAEAG